MKIYGMQVDCCWEQPEATRRTVSTMLAAHPPETGSLVVLPEMYATGFSMNEECTAEPYSGPGITFLQGKAREYAVNIVAGVVTRRRNGPARNQAVVLDPHGSIKARYTKQQLFTFHGEAEHYTAGRTTTLVEIAGHRVGLFICYDLRFPELFRKAVRQGATMFVVIASWPEPRAMHWDLLLRARAIENQCFVVGVNRAGTDPFYKYIGGSVLVGPDGAVVANAGTAEAILHGDAPVSVVEEYRKQLPFLKDIR